MQIHHILFIIKFDGVGGSQTPESLWIEKLWVVNPGLLQLSYLTVHNNRNGINDSIKKICLLNLSLSVSVSYNSWKNLHGIYCLPNFLSLQSKHFEKLVSLL